MGIDIDALAEAILEPTRMIGRLLAEEIDKLGKRVELLRGRHRCPPRRPQRITTDRECPQPAHRRVTPGVLTMSREDYHADVQGPSLSAGIAKLLVNASPLHAWTNHPRLNPDYQPVESERFDIGQAVHALFLEGLDAVWPIDAMDWRTNAAKQARDDARAHGKIPLLEHDYKTVIAIVDAAKEQLASHRADPPLFKAGKPEQTLVWHEPDGTMCRARPDWLRDDFAAVDDLKTTARTASPEFWSRNLFTIGYDVQAAWYLRGLYWLTGKDALFRFCVVEISPPYALSVLTLSPEALALANRKIEQALRLWGKCLREDSWPGFAPEVHWVSPPAYLEAQWLAKEEREAA